MTSDSDETDRSVMSFRTKCTRERNGVTMIQPTNLSVIEIIVDIARNFKCFRESGVTNDQIPES